MSDGRVAPAGHSNSDTARMDFMEKHGQDWTLPEFCPGGSLPGEWEGYGGDDIGTMVTGHTLREVIDAIMDARRTPRRHSNGDTK